MYDQKSSLFVATRDVTRKECPWLNQKLVEGTVVFGREDSYGVCSDKGQAVSFTQYGCYFEVPKNALRRLGIPTFSNN